MDLKGTRWKGMNWINVSANRNKWQSIVNMVMDILVP
jgi:hypothetical protein